MIILSRRLSRTGSNTATVAAMVEAGREGKEAEQVVAAGTTAQCLHGMRHCPTRKPNPGRKIARRDQHRRYSVRPAKPTLQHRRLLHQDLGTLLHRDLGTLLHRDLDTLFHRGLGTLFRHRFGRAPSCCRIGERDCCHSTCPRSTTRPQRRSRDR